MEEELFFKELYVWLTGDLSKPWGWPEHTRTSLKIILDLIHKDGYIQKEQMKMIEKDKLAKALYDWYLTNPRVHAGLYSILSNNVLAEIETGFCYLLRAKEEDEEKWYKRAIETPFGFARVEYGNYLYKKPGNNPMMFTLFKEAAEQFNYSDGWNRLGWCYQLGIGTKRDDERGFDCYKKSAKQGNVAGIRNVAFCYTKNIGTYVSYQKAIKWYSKSKEYEDNVTKLLQFQSDQHRRFYGGNAQTLENVLLCDCMECRKLRYRREDQYALNRKWFQRWKLCESRCITTILCFHHLFAGKRIGVLIAKILWKDRDEKLKN